MNHQGTKVLETKRLILRPFTAQDAPLVYKNWTSDPRVTEYVSWNVHESAEATREWLAERETHYSEPDFYSWCVVLRETGEPIGDLTYFHFDDRFDSCSFGWNLGSAFWGSGYMPEAARATFEYLFDEVGVNRISAKHDTCNPKSGRAMIKAGMRYEGTLRQNGRNKQGGYADIAVYSILKSDRRRTDELR